jgi:3-oxo-5-alpha-steroid 4-dehydrogenase 3
MYIDGRKEECQTFENTHTDTFIFGYRNAVTISACRGKLMDKAPERALGPLSGIFVPQKWFAHFYAVGVVLNGTLLFLWRDGSSAAAQQGLTLLILAMFEFHLLRRFVETIWMMSYPKQARMHVVAYLFGLSYYVAVPLTYALCTDEPLDSSRGGIYLVGCILFFIGNGIQFHSHAILSKLGRKQPGRYVIPRGGMFTLVSCPHYFGEIVIYLGLALAALGSNSVLSWYPFIWVVVNLWLAAGMTHAWYKDKFKTYPSTRKALLPYVW